MTRFDDQAASLRRLSLGNALSASFAFLGGRASGVTTLGAELGSALGVTHGRRVLLLDGHAGQPLLRRFNLSTSETLDTVLSQQLALDAAVSPLGGTINLLNGYARPSVLAALSDVSAHRVQSEYLALTRDTEFVLIDAPTQTPLLAAVAGDIVLVLSPDQDGLTETYTAVKYLVSEFGRRKFNVLVNRVHSLDEAQHWFSRLSTVASEYLPVSLRWVGYVPEDHWAKRATVLKTTAVQSFDTSEIATAANQLAHALPLWATGSGVAHELFSRLCDAARLLEPDPSEIIV